MENNDRVAKMTELLEKIFSNVNSWLLFAEAKNAAIIAFNVALIAALFGINELGRLGYLVSLIILISSVLALVSFIPDIGNDNPKGYSQDSKKNLLLFSHIAHYTKEQYLIAVYKEYFSLSVQENNLYRLELDYADEITYNAKITVNKYKWFKRALCVDFLGIIGILFLIIIA